MVDENLDDGWEVQRKGTRVPEIGNKIPAVQGKMGGHKYYSFCVEPEILLRLCFVLHRTNPNRETLSSYQRMLKKKRIKEIGQFVEAGGMFPNSIVINFDEDKGLRFDLASSVDVCSHSKLGVLHLPKRYHSAFVIDGQHRLYGYAGSEYRKTNAIPVVAFENLPSEKQAELFVDINPSRNPSQGIC